MSTREEIGDDLQNGSREIVKVSITVAAMITLSAFLRFIKTSLGNAIRVTGNAANSVGWKLQLVQTFTAAARFGYGRFGGCVVWRAEQLRTTALHCRTVVPTVPEARKIDKCTSRLQAMADGWKLRLVQTISAAASFSYGRFGGCVVWWAEQLRTTALH